MFESQSKKQAFAVASHLSILGKPVRDRVTGFEGVATSVNFELYGCIQILVDRPSTKEGKLSDRYWFDVARLELQSDVPVMNQPRFEVGYIAQGKKGGTELPVP